MVLGMNKTDKEHIEFVNKQIEKAAKTFPDLDPNDTLGFFRIHHILVILPMSKSTWYAGIQSGAFPKGACIGNNIRVWLKLDILTLANSTCKCNIKV